MNSNQSSSQQQQPYLNYYNNPHVRQPEATLFEDSPDSSVASSAYNIQKNQQQNRLHQMHHLIPPRATQSQSYPQQSTIQANNQRPTQKPATHHHPLYSFSHQQPQTQSNRYNQQQQEESGGVLHADIHDIYGPTKMEGGPQEDRVQQQLRIEDEDFERQVLPSNSNDAEFIIMNLYSKMKSLENKYIDLANFYKQELVQQREPDRSSQGQSHHTLSPPRSPRNETIPSKSGRMSDRHHSLIGSPSKLDLVSERQIINDLIEEKKKLEEDMKQVMSLRGTSLLNQSSPLNLHLNQESIPNREQLQFLNQQLHDAFSEITEGLESTQKMVLSYLSAKQNEMYQLATSRTTNLQPQIKNEALGLWYDSKIKVASLIGDLKSMVSQRKSQIEGNLLKINSARQTTQPTGFLKQLEATVQSGTQFFDEGLRKELTSMRKKQEHHQKSVLKLRNAFRFKEGLIKEEQQKLYSLIKDLQQTSYEDSKLFSSQQQHSRRNDQRSGDRSNNAVMSPFEKKIASYQKSAEKRKQPENRSGSRPRPVQQSSGQNFYSGAFNVAPHHTIGTTVNNSSNHSSNNQLADPYQIIHHPSQTIADEPVDVFATKLKILHNCFDDFTGKLLVRGQDMKDMDRLFDNLLSDFGKYASQFETIQNMRSRSKNNRNDLSPGVSSNFSPFNAGVAHTQQNNERKVNDLMRNNDQIYQELRKATEKYLNQKVENSKLRDEIQILHSQIDRAQQQSNSKITPTSPVPADGSRQQIRLKSRPNRYTQEHSALNVSAPTGPPQRNLSSNSSHVNRENEELKKRIRDLEKECFQLTYYQQEMQRRGADPHSGETHNLKIKLDQLCLQVQQFMLAMRRLQRAVNNKDKDIQDLKADFERNKKLLEQMVKEFKEKQHNTSSQMIVGSGEKMIQENRQIRNASQQQKVQVGPNTSYTNNNQYSITQRNDTNTNVEQSSSTNNLPPKKGVIRAKHNIEAYQPNPRNILDNSGFNLSNPDFGFANEPSQSQQITFEQDQFNNLQEELKKMSEESERLRRQISDLKLQIDEVNNSRNAIEAKLNAKHASLHKANEQLQQEQDKVTYCERLVGEYKECLYKLESGQCTLDPRTINHLKKDLLHREQSLLSTKYKATNTFGKQSLQTQTEEPVVSQNYIDDIKRQVVQLIALKEDEIDMQMREITDRLNDKDQDLTLLKKLFVEKLRELESSFVELSQDMIETEVVQSEASKRNQSTKLNQQAMQAKVLERSLEHVIGRIDDENDDQLEQLAALNDQLIDENLELREQVKEMSQNQEMETLRAQFEELHEDNELLDNELQLMRIQRETDRVALEQQKRVQDKLRTDSAEQVKLQDQVQLQYQQQLNSYEQLLSDLRQRSEEESQKIDYNEKEIASSNALVQRLKSDLSKTQIALDLSNKLVTDLKFKVESLAQQLQLVENLRVPSMDSYSSDDQQVDQARIDSDPVEAAQHYLRLMKTTEKEYKIQQSNRDKLQLKYEELKEKNDLIKVEARESAQEIMNMESTNFDLAAQNERLTLELDKTKGSFKVDEDLIKQEVEEHFRQRLTYKDSEIESINTKLARISQSNIEFKTRCDRLEASNGELQVESEQNRNRVQTLELELEMTKVNAERDIENLLDQHKCISNDKEALQLEFNTQIQQIQSVNLESTLLAQQSEQLKLENRVLSEKIDHANSEHKSQIQVYEIKLKDLIQKGETDLEKSNAIIERLNNEKSQAMQIFTERKEVQQQQLSKLKLEVKLVVALQKHFQNILASSLHQLNDQVIHSVETTKASTVQNLEIINDIKRQLKEVNLAKCVLLWGRIILLRKLEGQTQATVIAQQNAVESLKKANTEFENEVSKLLQQNLSDQESQQRSQKQLELKIQLLQKEQQDLITSMTQQQDQQSQELLLQKDSEISKLREHIDSQREENLQILQSEREVHSLELVALKSKEAESTKSMKDGLLRQLLQLQTELDESKEHNQIGIQKLTDQLHSKHTIIEQLQQQIQEGKTTLDTTICQLKEQTETLLSCQNQLTIQKSSIVHNEVEISQLLHKISILEQNEMYHESQKEVTNLKTQLAALFSTIAEMKELLIDKDEIININKDRAAILTKQVRDQKDLYEHQITELTQSCEVEKEAFITKIRDITHELTEQNIASISDINYSHSETLQSQVQSHQAAIESLNKQHAQKLIQQETLFIRKFEEIEGELSIEQSEKGDSITKIAELEQYNDKLQMRINELVDEMEDLKRSQSESENDQVKGFSTRLMALEVERDEALTKKAELELTSNDLKLIITDKAKEVDAQGQDLEQLYKEMDERQAEYEENTLNLQSDIKQSADDNEQLRQELQQIQDQRVSEREALIRFEVNLMDLSEEVLAMTRDHAALKQTRVLTDSLIEIVEADRFDEVIGEIGSDILQYCKRVKYLEKVWILMVKGDNYLWIDQDRVPLEQLKGIQIEEVLHQKHEAVELKLEELYKDKEALVRQQQNSTLCSHIGDQQSEQIKIKCLERDNARTVQELSDLQLINNSLQQSVLQCKTKISGMQDVIIKLTETEKSNDTITMIVSQKKDLKNKYMDQVEYNNRLQSENENLKRQILELSDLSFARNGAAFMSASGSVRRVDGPGGMIDGNLEDLSSIDRESEDERIEIQMNDKEKVLQQRVATLEDELVSYRNQIESLIDDNKKDLSNNSSIHQQNIEEEQEKLSTVKQIFIQYIESMPFADQKRESMLSVIYSMLNVTKEDQAKIQKSRQTAVEKSVKEGTKKGVMGFFGGAKK